MNCHLSSWLQHSHGDNVSRSVSLTARNYAPECCNLQLLSVNSNKSKENTQNMSCVLLCSQPINVHLQRKYVYGCFSLAINSNFLPLWP